MDTSSERLVNDGGTRVVGLNADAVQSDVIRVRSDARSNEQVGRNEFPGLAVDVGFDNDVLSAGPDATTVSDCLGLACTANIDVRDDGTPLVFETPLEFPTELSLLP